MNFIDRLIDMHFARDGARELSFPCMRLTCGFVVNEDQKRSINRILKPAYYVQLLALVAWWLGGTLGYMSSSLATWTSIAVIMVAYFTTTFALAKIYIGKSDATAKAERRLFEERSDALVADVRGTRFFRWSRVAALILIGVLLYDHLSAAASGSDLDFGFLAVLLIGLTILLVPPRSFVKWMRSRP